MNIFSNKLKYVKIIFISKHIKKVVNDKIFISEKVINFMYHDIS